MPGPLGTTPATQSIAYAGEGGGAPTTSYYVVGITDGTLTNALLITGNTWITGDTTVAGQAKWNIVDGSIGTTQLTNLNVTTGKIAGSAVTYAKMQNVSAQSLILGRSSSGAGVVEEIAPNGDLTLSGNLFTIGNAKVTYAKIQNVTDGRLLGRAAGSAGAPQEIAVTTGMSLGSTTLYATLVGSTNVTKTANQSFTATGLSNVSGLSFALTSGVTYQYEFYIVFGTSANTTGLKLGMTFPAVNWQGCYVSIPIADTGTASHFEGQIPASGNSVTGTAVGQTNTYYLAQINGVINPSSTGLLTVQANSEVAGSTVTIRLGSSGKLFAI